MDIFSHDDFILTTINLLNDCSMVEFCGATTVLKSDEHVCVLFMAKSMTVVYIFKEIRGRFMKFHCTVSNCAHDTILSI